MQSIEAMIQEIQKHGYRVYKLGPKKGSLKDIRENKEGDKPKRNTFESRYKRRSAMIEDEKELIDKCFDEVRIRR